MVLLFAFNCWCFFTGEVFIQASLSSLIVFIITISKCLSCVSATLLSSGTITVVVPIESNWWCLLGCGLALLASLVKSTRVMVSSWVQMVMLCPEYSTSWHSSLDSGSYNLSGYLAEKEGLTLLILVMIFYVLREKSEDYAFHRNPSIKTYAFHSIVMQF